MAEFTLTKAEVDPKWDHNLLAKRDWKAFYGEGTKNGHYQPQKCVSFINVTGKDFEIVDEATQTREKYWFESTSFALVELETANKTPTYPYDTFFRSFVEMSTLKGLVSQFFPEVRHDVQLYLGQLNRLVQTYKVLQNLENCITMKRSPELVGGSVDLVSVIVVEKYLGMLESMGVVDMKGKAKFQPFLDLLHGQEVFTKTNPVKLPALTGLETMLYQTFAALAEARGLELTQYLKMSLMNVIKDRLTEHPRQVVGDGPADLNSTGFEIPVPPSIDDINYFKVIAPICKTWYPQEKVAVINRVFVAPTLHSVNPRFSVMFVLNGPAIRTHSSVDFPDVTSVHCHLGCHMGELQEICVDKNENPGKKGFVAFSVGGKIHGGPDLPEYRNCDVRCKFAFVLGVKPMESLGGVTHHHLRFRTNNHNTAVTYDECKAKFQLPPNLGFEEVSKHAGVVAKCNEQIELPLPPPLPQGPDAMET